MADEFGAAGAGAAGGAASGAAFGPWGVAGGAVLGGASGYLGGKGAKKRRRAQEAARAKFQAALALYQQQELAQNAQREALLNQQMGQSQQNFTTYMGQKPGDQTAALQHDAQQQASALYAAQAPTPALAGPLAGQYQQEMDKRVGTQVNGMALDYSADQQGYAGDQSMRDYQMADSALDRDRNMFEQQANLGSALHGRDRSKAEAEYGVERTRANQAGGEHMLYGGLLNTALGVGNQYASAQRQSALRREGYNRSPNPALDNNTQGYDMRAQNPYIQGARP